MEGHLWGNRGKTSREKYTRDSYWRKRWDPKTKEDGGGKAPRSLERVGKLPNDWKPSGGLETLDDELGKKKREKKRKRGGSEEIGKSTCLSVRREKKQFCFNL